MMHSTRVVTTTVRASAATSSNEPLTHQPR